MGKKKTIITKKSQKHQQVIYLLVEGETEKNYFLTLKNRLNLHFKIHIETRPKIVRDVKGFVERYRAEKNIADHELYLVYDLENEFSEYRKFFNKNKKIIPNAYLSQSCFEVFIMLHFKNDGVVKEDNYDAHQRLDQLRELEPNFKKGFNYDYSSIISNHNLYKVIKKELELHDYQAHTFCDVSLLVKKLMQ